jgi:tetratricopeptide (TPR) repeat protein
MLTPAFLLSVALSTPTIQVDMSQLAPEASSAITTQHTKAKNNPKEWFVLGQLYHAHGLEEQAITAYVYSLSQEENPQARYLLGVALARIGNYEEAIENAKQVKDYVPAIWQQGYWNLDLGNFDIAATRFIEAISTDRNCVAAIIGLARVYLATNLPDKAILLLEDVISRGGSHPYLTFLLGTAHRRAGNHETASRLLATPVNGPPRWEDPYTQEMMTFTKGYAADLARAMESIDNGKLTDAVKQLEALAKRYPKDNTVLNNLGTVYLKLGKINEAKTVLNKGIRSSPSYAPLQLTMAYVSQAQGNLELAIAYASKAISLQPAMSPAHALAGQLSFQMGDLKSASSYFAKAIQLGNSDISIREMHGMVLLNLGKANDALKQFDLVLQISDRRPISLSGKAIATALLGNPDEALRILAAAKTKFPNDPNIERAWKSVLNMKASR